MDDGPSVIRLAQVHETLKPSFQLIPLIQGNLEELKKYEVLFWTTNKDLQGRLTYVNTASFAIVESFYRFAKR